MWEFIEVYRVEYFTMEIPTLVGYRVLKDGRKLWYVQTCYQNKLWRKAKKEALEYIKSDIWRNDSKMVKTYMALARIEFSKAICDKIRKEAFNG